MSAMASKGDIAAANVKPATIKATLYLPPSAFPAPAMVIMSSTEA